MLHEGFEYPCHVRCQASPAQPLTSSTHVCRPDPPPIQVSMSACPGLLSASSTAGLFTSRAKHRWTVLDQPPLGFVSNHWQRSVKRPGPPALHSQVDLWQYRPRHRTYRTGKRQHTAHEAAVYCTPPLGTTPRIFRSRVFSRSFARKLWPQFSFKALSLFEF